MTATAEIRFPWRRLRLWFRWLSIIVAGLIYVLCTAVITRDTTLQTAQTPNMAAPSLDELNAAIGLAEQYIDRLYRPLDAQTAVQSEYYGLPLKVFFPERQEWSLLSKDTSSAITPGESSQNTEEYFISFESGSLVMKVAVHWLSATDTSFEIVIVPQAVKEAAEVWLGERLLGSYRPDMQVLVANARFTSSEVGQLASLRYTVRHATQQAYLYYQAKGDTAKAHRLARFLETNGYTPGKDMRAIILNHTHGREDDFAHSVGSYSDCEHLPQPTELAYAYKSKACKALEAYFVGGQRDTYMQSAEALQALQDHHEPERQYGTSFLTRLWMQGNTPQDTAEHLRKQWSRTHSGIPACTPISCHEVSSGIRTFTYGTLETELGYHYGDPVAAKFADAAARMALQAQITDGFVTTSEHRAYRPAHTGAFPTYWDRDGNFTPPAPSFVTTTALALLGDTGMPPEYVGILPSNSETTLDGWAFLVRYRCLKYHADCIL